MSATRGGRRYDRRVPSSVNAAANGDDSAPGHDCSATAGDRGSHIVRSDLAQPRLCSSGHGLRAGGGPRFEVGITMHRLHSSVISSLYKNRFSTIIIVVKS